jgi:hypothetical protein
MESSGSMHASVWLEQEDFKSGAPGITQAGEDKGKGTGGLWAIPQQSDFIKKMVGTIKRFLKGRAWWCTSIIQAR